MDMPNISPRRIQKRTAVWAYNMVGRPEETDMINPGADQYSFPDKHLNKNSRFAPGPFRRET